MPVAKEVKPRVLMGLAMALLVIPRIAIGFRAAFVLLDSTLVNVRELSIFAAAMLLLVMVKRGERQTWPSIGLRSISADKAAAAIVVGLLPCAAATVLEISAANTKARLSMRNCA